MMATPLKQWNCMNQYRMSISQIVRIRGIQAFFESYTSKFKRPFNHFEWNWRWINMAAHKFSQSVVMCKALNISVDWVVLLFAYKIYSLVNVLVKYVWLSLFAKRVKLDAFDRPVAWSIARASRFLASGIWFFYKHSAKLSFLLPPKYSIETRAWEIIRRSL